MTTPARAGRLRDGTLPLPARAKTTLRDAIEADPDVVAVTSWLLALALAVLLPYGEPLFG